MRSIGLLTLASLLLLGLGSLTTASAALPEFTPVPNKVAGKSGKITIQQKGGATITCKTAESLGKSTDEIKTEKTGQITWLLSGCETLGKVCTDLLDTIAGTILVSALVTLAVLSHSVEGLLLAVEEIHFECGAGAQLIAMKGCAIALVTPINTKTKLLSLNLSQKEGANEYTKTESKTECKLLSQVEAKGSLQTGLGMNEATMNLEKEGELKG